MNPKESQIDTIQDMIQWLNSFQNHPKGMMLKRDGDTFHRIPKTLYSSISRLLGGESRITNVDDITSFYQKKWRNVDNIIDSEANLFRQTKKLSLDVLYWQTLNQALNNFSHGITEWGRVYEHDTIFSSKLQTLTVLRLGVGFKKLYWFTDECGIEILDKNQFIVPPQSIQEPKPEMNLRDVFTHNFEQNTDTKNNHNRETDDDDEEIE